MSRRRPFFISVGEFSGDLIAADLVQYLKNASPTTEFFGITGDALERSGVTSVGTISELSVMGIVEVIKKLPSLLDLESRVLAEIDRRNPEIAILVDFPGFHFRLAEQLKLRGIKVIQYVAPKLWAWGANRAPALRDNFDLVLGILPFETEYFSKLGVNYKYVGSPQIDRVGRVVVEASDLGFSNNQKIVACLPGSRMNEVSRMLPVIYSVANELEKTNPGMKYVVPVASNLELEDVVECLKDSGFDHELVKDDEDQVLGCWKYGKLHFVKGMSLEVMSVADVAVVTSGTATLECGLLGTPMVVVYSMNEMTYEMAKSRVTISDFSLVNIVAGKKVVKEYIQRFEISEIVKELAVLLEGGEECTTMKNEFKAIAKQLKGHAGRAASIEILEMISRK